MINEEARQYVVDAIEKEMSAAVENYGHFHSDHEFWAVLREEVEELGDAFFCGFPNNEVDGFWQKIRDDEDIAIDRLAAIKSYALNLIFEAVQVAAVIDKYIVNKEREKINVCSKTKES